MLWWRFIISWDVIFSYDIKARCLKLERNITKLKILLFNPSHIARPCYFVEKICLTKLYIKKFIFCFIRFLVTEWITPKFSIRNITLIVTILLANLGYRDRQTNGCRIYVDIMTGEKIISIYVANNVIIYWLVRSSSKRGGDCVQRLGESLF